MKRPDPSVELILAIRNAKQIADECESLGSILFAASKSLNRIAVLSDDATASMRRPAPSPPHAPPNESIQGGD